MEAVDELEAKRDHQGHEQQDIGQDGGGVDARLVDIDIDAVSREQQSATQQAKEQDHRSKIHRPLKMRSRRALWRNLCRCDVSHVWLRSVVQALGRHAIIECLVKPAIVVCQIRLFNLDAMTVVCLFCVLLEVNGKDSP